ncbi:hypothetical protein D043_3700B, partial [Vibrio parahaemolyticus EKP-021]
KIKIEALSLIYT